MYERIEKCEVERKDWKIPFALGFYRFSSFSVIECDAKSGLEEKENLMFNQLLMSEALLRWEPASRCSCRVEMEAN